MAKFCSNCGGKLDPKSTFCPSCGFETNTNYNTNGKSKLGAGLLGIFLGGLGIHNFYLGYNNKALSQLLLTVIGSLLCGIGPIVAAIWGFVEGIEILTGSISCDADGNPLSD